MHNDLVKWLQNNKTSYTGPVLLFDRKVIEERLKLLQDIGDKYNCQFLMPTKSFRHFTIYQLAHKYLWGFDISNRDEYNYLPKNLNTKLVSLSDPSYHGYDLEHFLTKNNSLIIYIETWEQYVKLQEQEIKVNFGVRLNSSSLFDEDFSKHNSHYQSRFGVSSADLRLLRKITEPGKHKFVGFHIHHGTSKNLPSTIVRFARKSIEIAHELGIKISHINLGGGLSEIGFRQLELLIEELRSFVNLHIQIIFEPGNFLFEGAGFACGKVKSRKIYLTNHSFTLDLSKECHLRWSNPKLLQNHLKYSSKKQIKTSFYGPTCYEDDKLGEFKVPIENEKIPLYNINNFVLFSGITGYSVSWNAAFNGIKIAKVEFLN